MIIILINVKFNNPSFPELTLLLEFKITSISLYHNSLNFKRVFAFLF